MIRVISPKGVVEDKESVDARECVNILDYRYAGESTPKEDTDDKPDAGESTPKEDTDDKPAQGRAKAKTKNEE